jgi:hypothetical protein
MKLKRVAILLFGVGLGVALVSAVVDGLVMQSTLVACPGHEPAYTVGSYTGLAGLVVGLGGVLRERSSVD